MTLKARDEGTKTLPWFVLDAKQPIEVIHNQIKGLIPQIVEQNQRKLIPPLWMNL